MAENVLRLRAVRKEFPGGVIGLDSIDLDIAAGEFLTLLGPSGCGKTTTLRVIAGFESPSRGAVLLDGRDITALRAYDRPVNTVFQDYALFPHMNVSENIEFGLSLRKMLPAERLKKVISGLEMVGLADKAKARVGELSGGQRQRVALARAIVCEPRVLLLDEPLSALDAHLREQMQVELKRLQSSLGTTFVMVTHDQTEALSISDRIVVMNQGRIDQVAPPDVLYDRPATRFVAGFIGTMNLLDARFVGAEGSHSRFDIDGLTVVVASEGATLLAQDPVTIAIRPEDLVALPTPSPESVPARVTNIVFHGKALRLHTEFGRGTRAVIDMPRQAGTASCHPGSVIHIALRPTATCPILRA